MKILIFSVAKNPTSLKLHFMKKMYQKKTLSLAYFTFDEWATLRTAAALYAKKAEYLGKEAGAENSLESVNALRKCILVRIYLP